MTNEISGELPGPIVLPGSLTVAGQTPYLRGGACTSCSEEFFPMAQFCPACLSSAVDETRLPRHGTLEAYTIIESGGQPGVGTPYACGFVALGEAIRLFSPLSGVNDLTDLEAGMAVELVVEPVRTDPETGKAHFGHAFRPAEASG